MGNTQILLTVVIAIILSILACTTQPQTIVETVIVEVTSTPIPTQEEETFVQLTEPINTPLSEVTAPTNTTGPAPTEWIGVINCPECGGIALILWEQIGNMGAGGGKVMHGDVCIIIDQGVFDGIEKYRLNCDGKIGWLRAVGVQAR